MGERQGTRERVLKICPADAHPGEAGLVTDSTRVDPGAGRKEHSRTTDGSDPVTTTAILHVQ